MDFMAYVAGLNGYPDTDWTRSAYVGFLARGMKVKVFEFIEDVPVARNQIVVAGVDETYKYLAQLGIIPRRTMNVPEELMKYAERKIEYMTMGEFMKDERLPIFVKPNDRVKQFTAGVVSEAWNKRFSFQSVAEDVGVLVSEVIDIVSEYRCYVIEGELVGIKHYLGDIRIFPDVNVIDGCIRDLKDAPAGYSVDVGVTAQGRTVLVEVQDGWSLGNYGLEDGLYCRLLMKRWMELLKVGR